MRSKLSFRKTKNCFMPIGGGKTHYTIHVLCVYIYKCMKIKKHTPIIKDKCIIYSSKMHNI